MQPPRSFFENDTSARRSVVGIADGTRTLTPAQKKFNQLIERINLQRKELADWKAFSRVYHQQLADEYQPAVARLRKQQIAMALLLDRVLDGKALSQRERARARELLTELLSQLLIESGDAELERLHDKHAQQSFMQTRQEELQSMRTLASEEFDVDIGVVPSGESPDEFARWIDEQLRARDDEPAPSRPRKKSAKARAREKLRQLAAESGTRAVREVFRKLASELHPDRESDPDEQARKTALMQRVNAAYKAGDLLTLLELQLSIEQIHPAALSQLAEERLQHYINVLESQSQRLRDELAEFVAPFASAADSRGQKLSPSLIRRGLEADICRVEALARALQADLVRFEDVRWLKRSLREYQFDPEEDMIFDEPRGPRRRGRRPRSRRS